MKPIRKILIMLMVIGLVLSTFSCDESIDPFENENHFLWPMKLGNYWNYDCYAQKLNDKHEKLYEKLKNKKASKRINLASGVYIYRITIQSFEGSQSYFTKTSKMMLLK